MREGLSLFVVQLRRNLLDTMDRETLRLAQSWCMPLSWHNYHQSSLSPSFPVWTISCLTPKLQEVWAISSRGQMCFCLSTQLPGPHFLSPPTHHESWSLLGAFLVPPVTTRREHRLAGSPA